MQDERLDQHEFGCFIQTHKTDRQNKDLDRDEVSIQHHHDPKVALVRHPRPLVAPGLCYGQIDLPTHPDAAAQIEAVVQGLGSFAPRLVWSSPALRCMGMANALQMAFDAELRCDPRLLEMNFGEWEGMSWDSVSRAALDRWAADPWTFAAPGGETGQELVTRVSAIHTDILNEGRDCVVVTHGGPLKVLRALQAGAEIDLLAPALPIGAWEIT